MKEILIISKKLLDIFSVNMVLKNTMLLKMEES